MFVCRLLLAPCSSQAVYDNDVDYLEILLDHAIAAQEVENEELQAASPNSADPPVSGGYNLD